MRGPPRAAVGLLWPTALGLLRGQLGLLLSSLGLLWGCCGAAGEQESFGQVALKGTLGALKGPLGTQEAPLGPWGGPKSFPGQVTGKGNIAKCI